MKKLLLSTGAVCMLLYTYSQENDSLSLGKKIDDLTYKWDREAEKLSYYEGLAHFCLNNTYRYGIIDLLQSIHHYDSVLYDRLVKASRFDQNHEIKKTLMEIEKFEEGYDMKGFIHFLHEECNARSDIERHSDELKSEIGANSYDGKIYILENELAKYIHHITKRVDHIREHVHHLHIK